MSSVVREPAVAGTFYPAQASVLRRDLVQMMQPLAAAPESPRLLLVPHAGHAYSGAIAAAAYRLIAPPPLIVVLAPNHHGIGATLALPLSGRWRTPLGTLAIDEEASTAIAARDVGMSDDWRAHARDHALEVQLPFLQVLATTRACDEPCLVTLSCGTHDLAELLAAGEAIAAALRGLGRDATTDVLLVVSTDMSHYIPAAEARELDMPVLELASRVDPEGVHAEVFGRGISMCGVAPAVVGLAAARALGARSGRLLRYGHSGEVTGDDKSVVAYAALVVDP